MHSAKNEPQRRPIAQSQRDNKNAPRRIATAALRFLFFSAAASAISPVMAAEGTTPDFPANSAEPQAAIAPAKGLPTFDDGTGADEAGADTDDTTASSPAKPRPESYRFGITLVTPVAGTVEQRIPVSMRAGGSGTMRAWAYGGEISARRITEDFMAYGDFEYRRTDFAFSGPAPFGDTDRYKLNAHVETALGDDWWLFTNGGLNLGAEREADLDDALSGRVAFGAKYRFIPEFSYYFGISVMTRLDRDPLIIPMTAFDLRFGKWSARTLNGLVIAYDVNGDNDLVLDFSALYDTSDFRRTNDAAGRGRVVEFQEVPVSFGITKAVGRHSFIRTYITAIAWSDYRFRTDGATTGDFQTDPGLIFGLSGGARF